MTLKIIHTALLAGALTVAASAQTVNQREANQQDRVAQGVRSGQLTPRETAHIEHHEAKINREVRRDRAMNGGHLTRAEHAKVTRQQNRASRQIYRDKHNAART